VDITPRATKQAKLLALLALGQGRSVSPDECIEELWSGKPPRSANAAIHTYIRKLRHLISAAKPNVDPKSVIVTRFGGYQLASESIDAEEFERLADQGHRSASAGDCIHAADRFRKALALWRGPVLGGLPTGPLLAVRQRELEERRKAALDRCIALELTLGRHYELLGELIAYAADDRTHEQLHAQLMLALYRAGRRAQALEVYRDLRQELSNRLGLEPSPRVQALQRAILTSDGTLQRTA
jgi:DNA-binding SARP family transcriptional activator